MRSVAEDVRAFKRPAFKFVYWKKPNYNLNASGSVRLSCVVIDGPHDISERPCLQSINVLNGLLGCVCNE